MKDKLIEELGKFASRLYDSRVAMYGPEVAAELVEILSRHADEQGEGSVKYPCPTCGAERFKTERRINGDSWCRYGHKHPTRDFVRPTPTKPTEPLAVFVDQYGWFLKDVMYFRAALTWSICLCRKQSSVNYESFKRIEARTYALAEQAARAYLEALPDVKGGVV